MKSQRNTKLNTASPALPSTESKRFLDEFFRGVGDGILVLDRDLNILHYNDAILQLSPQTLQDGSSVLSRPCFKCLRGLNSPCRRCPVRKTFRDGRKHEHIEHIEEKDLWLELSSFPLQNEKTDRVDRVVEFVRDITVRKKGEETLKESEEKYRKIFDGMPDGMALLDVTFDPRNKPVEFRYVEMNSALSGIYGIPPAQMIGGNFKDVHPEMRTLGHSGNGDWFRVAGLSALAGVPDVILVHDGLSGKFLQLSVFRIHRNRIGLFVSDVTLRLTTSKKVRRYDSLMNSLIETAEDGIVAVDGAGEISYANSLARKMIREWSEFCGIDSEKIRLSRELLRTIAGKIAENSGSFQEEVERFKRDNKPLQHILSTRRGRVLKIRAHAIPQSSEGSEISRVWRCREITEEWNAQQRICESEEQFRRLFDSLSNGLLLLNVERDDSGKPTDYFVCNANPTFGNAIGIIPELLIGRSIYNLFHDLRNPSDDSATDCWTGLDAAADGQGGSYHLYIEEFSPHPYQEAVVFPYGENRIAVLFYDETPRILSERSSRTMQLIIDHISEPVIWLDLAGTIRYGNKAAVERFGYMPDESIRGIKIWEFDTSLDAPDWPEFVRKLALHKTSHFETEMTRKDGSRFQSQVVVDCLEQNGEPFLAVCLHDLTEQVRRIRAEQDSDAKTLFLARMSHEIRTPLNGVIGMSELLMKTELTAKQREYTELVRASGKYLLSLISDILDFSKIEAGKLEVEYVEFDLADLAESALGILAARATENEVELFGAFQTDAPRQVVGDPGRIRQVLLNLLGNAVKFTRQGGVQLLISVLDWEVRQGSPCALIRFEVRDSGIGIAAEELEHLFCPFYQSGEPLARQQGGTGLGLAISKDLVQLMGGEIGVETCPGQGSTFWFTLPLRCPGQDMLSCSMDHGNAGCSSHRAALVVEGNDMFGRILLEQMKSWGMDVSWLSGKRNAFSEIKKAFDDGMPFRIVVVDGRIEDRMAIECIRTVKNDPHLAATPVIMLTPLACDLCDSVYATGKVDRLVVKPFFGTVLYDAIMDVIAEGPALRDPERRERIRSYRNDYVENRSVQKFLNNYTSSADVSDSGQLQKDDQDVVLLIAEDNRVNQIVVSEILAQSGFRFEVVENGRKACDAVTNRKFSLVLMDCQMPVMDGYQATKTIRLMESGQGEKTPCHEGRIPIIALTANAVQGDEELCLHSGMDAYCSKPIRATVLIETIRKWLPQAVAGET